MEKFAKYAKRSEGAYFDYLPSDWNPSSGILILLRVTLGIMPLEDAFTIQLPSSYARLTMGELFSIVFSSDAANKADMRECLDLRTNPDLLDMYEGLLEIFEGCVGGRYSLQFFINNGAEVNFSRPLSSYLRVCRSISSGLSKSVILDLVIEQRLRSLDYAEERGYVESSSALLGWMQERSILYALGIDHHEQVTAVGRESHKVLWRRVESLVDQGLLRHPGDQDTLEVTSKGHDLLVSMATEAEAYVKSYGIYRDVLYDPESSAVEFGTGLGRDLRIQAYLMDGIGSTEAMFLVTLFGAEGRQLCDMGPEWIGKREHFEDILAPVLDDFHLGEAEIAHVVESGLAIMEERKEELEREKQESWIMDRSQKSPL